MTQVLQVCLNVGPTGSYISLLAGVLLGLQAEHTLVPPPHPHTHSKPIILCAELENH